MSNTAYRQDIQGLRAIAVLAVMTFHLNPVWLPGGFVGVDIFLVISGFLISSILLHKKAKPEYQLLSTLNYFYRSRLKRIAPAYFTVLIVVTLLAAVLFLPADFATYRGGLKKAAWFNSNSYFATFGDYFAPANHEQPLLHTWSLAIEIQFYLLAPFIFLLFPKRLLNWLLPLSIIALTAYAEYRLRMLGLEQATYYSLIARLPAFFMGAWVALLIGKKDGFRLGDRCKRTLIWLAIALIATSLCVPKLTGYFPGIAGLTPITGAALIIFLNASNPITQFLSSRILVWIGALSYSLYLWHWPVLAFMRYYTGAAILNWQYNLAFVLLTVALATASFYWIETPLRLKRSKKQILGYASLAAVVVLTAVGMKKMNAYYTPEPLPVEYTRYADPKTICHGQIVGNCLKGDLSSDKEVLVIGDSHAAMLNHFFDYLGKELAFKARVITASSCVTIPEFNYQRIPEYSHKACLAQIEEAKGYLKEAEVVFIAASWDNNLKYKHFEAALDGLVQSKPETKFFVISQEPRLSRNPLRARRFEYLGFNSVVEVNPSYKKANHILEDKCGQYVNLSLLDLTGLKVFELPPFYQGDMVYYDEHHINEVASKIYAKQALTTFKNLDI
ncbi:acyltransferase family protein [Oceanisphaera sediminis]|uniref:Acyltransferase family protein n=1 Tax=Oceanisphaera sediminis TaxID=981381 RepID=A0ABP7DN16_9GAMM